MGYLNPVVVDGNRMLKRLRRMDESDPPSPHLRHSRDRAAWRRAARTVWRPALFGLGWICLGVGIAGLFLPLLPGTLFLILAGACFTRSSPRFEAWLLGHPRFGPPIRQWRETGSVPRYAKVFAIGSLTASGLLLLATGAPTAVKVLCLLIFSGVAVYVGSRPEV